jgi:hypothetical protein
MDMEERKQETLWIFPDSANLPIFGIFEDCKTEISKNGSVSFPVITLDNAGTKIKLSKWRTDVLPCVVKYGKNSDDWKGKLFQVSLNERLKKIELKPLEQEIK